MPGKGIAVAAGTAGIILIWSGVENRTVLDTVRSLIAGKKPSPGASPVQTITGVVPQSSGSGTSLSTAQVKSLWIAQGGPADTADFAAAVAMAESGGSPTVTSGNPDGGTNVGLYQLDTKGVGANYPVADLQDPAMNTSITILATNGGTNWQEWGDPVTAAVGYHYTPGQPVP